MKYLLSIFFIVFFQGCAFTGLSASKTINNEKTYRQTINANKNFQTNSTQVYTKKSNITPKTSVYFGSIISNNSQLRSPSFAKKNKRRKTPKIALPSEEHVNF